MIQGRYLVRTWLAAGALALVAFSGTALADPPSRVARLSFLRGDVSFQPAGESNWVQAQLNRPLMTGDALYTDRAARTELEIGAASMRLDQGTSFSLLNLDDNNAQIELTEGVLNLNVRRVFEGQTYEINTPTLAFVVSQPGQYRIDIAPSGDSTMITVFSGNGGDVYGQDNASYSVRSRQSYRFYDATLRDYEVLDLPRPDEFDTWCSGRDTRATNSVSRRYVSEDVIGYSDLDTYGSWSTSSSYGAVWYPTRVASGWAPYRNGNWTWIDPWGWTWVDNEPWGFAPSHYGRWAYVSNRWGWVPGPIAARPVYAPALVGFIGGSNWSVGISAGGGGGPVGWFPLGPREVYVPWYHSSRNYFTNVNVRNTTIINNTYITNVYNNYSAGRPIDTKYAYRGNVAAVTAVPRDAFVGARAVGSARLQLNQSQLARVPATTGRLDIAPTRSSFVAAGAARARVTPSAAVASRQVIARTAPPPRAVPVATRITAIERNGGRPLPTAQARELRAAAPNAARTRVQVVGQNAGKPQPIPARSGAPATRTFTQPGQADRQTRGQAPTRAPRDEVAPGNVRTPTRGTPPAATREPAARSNDRSLPSSGFAPQRGATRSAEPGTRAPTQPTPPSDARTRTPARVNTPAPERSRNEAVTPIPINRAPPRTAPEQRNEQRTTPTQRAEQQQRNIERATPVQRAQPQPRAVERAAPVQRETAPMRRELAPIQRESAPMRREAAPIQRESAPMRREAAPNQRESAPMRREAAPKQRENAPMRREAAPSRQATPQREPARSEAPQNPAREAPPQRNAPVREAPVRQAPVQRQSAPPRGEQSGRKPVKKDKDDDDKDRGGRNR